MEQDDTLPRPVPAGWLEVLRESEADVAAGRVVSGEAVKARLRQAIAEMEAESLAEASGAAPSR